MRPHLSPPTLYQQGLRLKQAQPDSVLKIKRGGHQLVWVGWLQPTPVSAKYRIRIEAHRSSRSSPKVFVEYPTLFTRNGELVPHVYCLERGEICLWRPKKGEWSPKMWLVDSVLLWASLWLFFYEVWHATGEWFGGGEHPEASE